MGKQIAIGHRTVREPQHRGIPYWILDAGEADPDVQRSGAVVRTHINARRNHGTLARLQRHHRIRVALLPLRLPVHHVEVQVHARVPFCHIETGESAEDENRHANEVGTLFSKIEFNSDRQKSLFTLFYRGFDEIHFLSRVFITICDAFIVCSFIVHFGGPFCPICFHVSKLCYIIFSEKWNVFTRRCDAYVIGSGLNADACTAQLFDCTFEIHVFA